MKPKGNTMFRKLLALPAAAAAALAGLALAGGVAHASVGGPATGIPVTAAHPQTIAGWYGTSNNADVFPTHLSATLGSDGANTLSNLAVWNESTDTPPTAAEGIGIGNSNTSDFAEIGIVNIGGGLMDVVADYGPLSTHGTQTTFGWVGLAEARPVVLLRHLPIATSVDVDLILQHGFAFGPVSGIQASARLAHYGNWNRTTLGFTPTVMDEVQAGVVNGSQPSVALNVTPSQIPLPNTSRFYMTNELGRVAHVDVSANVRGGHEFRGGATGAPLQTSTAFTGFPVYTFSSATAGEAVDLAPTAWASDNFAIEGGLPLGS